VYQINKLHEGHVTALEPPCGGARSPGLSERLDALEKRLLVLEAVAPVSPRGAAESLRAELAEEGRAQAAERRARDLMQRLEAVRCALGGDGDIVAVARAAAAAAERAEADAERARKAEAAALAHREAEVAATRRAEQLSDERDRLNADRDRLIRELDGSEADLGELQRRVRVLEAERSAVEQTAKIIAGERDVARREVEVVRRILQAVERAIRSEA
jgi:hypothetical protein